MKSALNLPTQRPAALGDPQVRIQYGGSVTPENCKELITKPNIDGFLVGVLGTARRLPREQRRGHLGALVGRKMSVCDIRWLEIAW